MSDIAIVEAGECAFCDAPVPVHDEGTIVALYQILCGDDGIPFLLCDTCWHIALRGAPATSVSQRAGVSTIVAR